MRPGRLLLTVCVMAAILMTAAGSTAQSTSKIYGYVSYGGTYVNNAVVTLGGDGYGQMNTTDKDGHAGYYGFDVSAGNYVVTASYNGHSAWHAYAVSSSDVQINLDISTATPTPTPTPVPSPTPRPSHEPGGLVYRNDSSQFIPVAADYTVTPAPRPTIVWTPTPTPAPATPTPTPTPAPGLLSNVYVLLGIVLVAILAIAIALFAVIFLKK